MNERLQRASDLEALVYTMAAPREFHRPPVLAAPSPENAVGTCFSFTMRQPSGIRLLPHSVETQQAFGGRPSSRSR